MNAVKEVNVFHNVMFVDKLSIELVCKNKENIIGFMDENSNPISKKVVADWIMENYYNETKFKEYCRDGRYRRPETAKELYQWNEEYRKSVDEERLYLLYLIKLPITEIADIVGVSRQTVYSRIKVFEEKRLNEILRYPYFEG